MKRKKQTARRKSCSFTAWTYDCIKATGYQARSHIQRKATDDSVMSIRMYIRMYQRSPNWTDFMKFDIADFNENPSRNSKFDKNRTKISGTLPEDLSTFIFLNVV